LLIHKTFLEIFIPRLLPEFRRDEHLTPFFSLATSSSFSEQGTVTSGSQYIFGLRKVSTTIEHSLIPNLLHCNNRFAARHTPPHQGFQTHIKLLSKRQRLRGDSAKWKHHYPPHRSTANINTPASQTTTSHIPPLHLQQHPPQAQTYHKAKANHNRSNNKVNKYLRQ
jgi:hypothetical protein